MEWNAYNCFHSLSLVIKTLQQNCSSLTCLTWLCVRRCVGLESVQTRWKFRKTGGLQLYSCPSFGFVISVGVQRSIWSSWWCRDFSAWNLSCCFLELHAVFWRHSVTCCCIMQADIQKPTWSEQLRGNGNAEVFGAAGSRTDSQVMSLQGSREMQPPPLPPDPLK